MRIANRLTRLEGAVDARVVKRQPRTDAEWLADFAEAHAAGWFGDMASVDAALAAGDVETLLDAAERRWAAWRVKTMQWYGWYRRSEAHPWIKAVSADSLDACAKLLDKATKGLRINSVNQIMTGGGYPRVGTKQKETTR